jgi:hypothetical protein
MTGDLAPEMAAEEFVFLFHNIHFIIVDTTAGAILYRVFLFPGISAIYHDSIILTKLCIINFSFRLRTIQCLFTIPFMCGRVNHLLVPMVSSRGWFHFCDGLANLRQNPLIHTFPQIFQLREFIHGMPWSLPSSPASINLLSPRSMLETFQGWEVGGGGRDLRFDSHQLTCALSFFIFIFHFPCFIFHI